MKGTPIFNASLTHATVALFRCRFSVEALTPSGGYEIVSHALGFVRKPHSELNILLEETALELYRYNPFVQILKDFPRVEFRLIPEEKQSRYTYHFVVADSSCYRFSKTGIFLPRSLLLATNISGAISAELFSPYGNPEKSSRST